MRPLPKKGYERSEVERLRLEVAKLKGKLETAKETVELYEKEANLLLKVVHKHQTQSRRYEILRGKELIIMDPGEGAKYLTGADLDEYLEPWKITRQYMEKMLIEMSKHFRSVAQPTTLATSPEMHDAAVEIVNRAVLKEIEDGTNP
jgi:hypothetical protein